MQRETLLGTAFVVLALLAVDVGIILDIPVFRQILVSVFFSFVPGFVLLKILKADGLDTLERVVFSLGLSVSLVMFLGLLVNESLPVLGIETPLSTVNILAAMNFLTLSLCLVAWLKKVDLGFSLESLRFHPSIVPFACLPFLSIFGMFLVNSSRNNIVLELMIVLIAALVVMSSISTKLIPSKMYPLALLAIVIALLLHSSLMTNYIVGWDEHNEYYISTLVQKNMRWNSGQFIGGYAPDYYSMLSVTILPVMYSTMMKIDIVWIFKIMYPLILSFVPLAFYRIYQTETEEKTAFLAAFFMVSNSVFFALFPERQIIAELFYVSSFLVLLSGRIDSWKKNLLFIILSGALIVSHYSISYLFLISIFLVWSFSTFVKKGHSTIKFSHIALFSVMAFAWYIYTSNSAPFAALLNTFGRVSNNFMMDFFNPQTRGSTVLQGLGVVETSTIARLIGRGFYYLTELLVLVGFIGLLASRKIKRFSSAYTALGFVNMAILVASIILPNFATAFGMDRFYQTSLLILSPLCILGGQLMLGLTKKVRKRWQSVILVSLVLMPFFLFQTELVYEFTGESSWSLPLRNWRMEPIRLYNSITTGQDVQSAQWLSRNMKNPNSIVYGDNERILHSYGLFYGQTDSLMNTTIIRSHDYVFLRRLNTIEGYVIKESRAWNTTDLVYVFDDLSKVYSNGWSCIYTNTQPLPGLP